VKENYKPPILKRRDFLLGAAASALFLPYGSAFAAESEVMILPRDSVLYIESDNLRTDYGQGHGTLRAVLDPDNPIVRKYLLEHEGERKIPLGASGLEKFLAED